MRGAEGHGPSSEGIRHDTRQLSPLALQRGTLVVMSRGQDVEVSHVDAAVEVILAWRFRAFVGMLFCGLGPLRCCALHFLGVEATRVVKVSCFSTWLCGHCEDLLALERVRAHMPWCSFERV